MLSVDTSHILEALAGFRTLPIVNLHWHHEMAKRHSGNDRKAAMVWLVEQIKSFHIRFVVGDANMAAYILVSELRDCGIECNLMAWHCELSAKESQLSFDSCVIIAIGGHKYPLKPHTVLTHCKMGAQLPGYYHAISGKVKARGYPPESYLKPLSETWRNSLLRACLHPKPSAYTWCCLFWQQQAHKQHAQHIVVILVIYR